MTRTKSYQLMRRCMRRRWRGLRLLLVVAVFGLGYLGTFTALHFPEPPGAGTEELLNSDHLLSQRHLLEDSTDGSSPNTTEAPKASVGDQYPEDLFTDRQLKKGAFVLHILGVIYMFIALAIVCDEFFVPSLEVITIRLKISEDVAGATFMAAGGSAPELFTSFIGVFIARSEVGIGTIVGSAVFNILFVIGMCALVSKEVLTLTWWPLFRDVSFYSISLICLIAFYRDKYIEWWEALILLSCYAAYVIFMKFNRTVEYAVKSKLQRNQVTTPPESRSSSVPHLKAGNSGKFRHGVLQLMIHTIDPLGEAKVHEKALKLHAIASLKVILGSENHNNLKERDQNNVQVGKNGSVPVAFCNGQATNGEGHRNFSQQTTVTTVSAGCNEIQTAESLDRDDGIFMTAGGAVNMSYEGNDAEDTSSQGNPSTNERNCPTQESKDEMDGDGDGDGDGEPMEGEPLDLSWPDTCRKRLTYLLLAPIIYLLWLTLPDVRRPEREKYFPWTFLGSIIWIALFAFLMNWWAAVVGHTFGIPDGVMGLTVLAAGTSIPDLITSVIVARKGYGDMAVSSSVGSNIFDVTVGLPLPWIIYTLSEGHSYPVSSTGMLCSIVLLFLMLIALIATIAAFKWKMNKLMGVGMFAFYFVFLVISLLLLFGTIGCPDVS